MRQPSVKDLQGGPGRVGVDLVASPRVLLERLTRAMNEQLGSARDEQERPLLEGVAPVLTEVRDTVLALDPEPGSKLLSLQAQAEARGKLGKTLDQMEDILEALQLAADESRGPAGRGGRGR